MSGKKKDSSRKNVPEYERGRIRGYREGDKNGYISGTENALTITFMVLKDKFGWSDHRIHMFAKYYLSIMETIESGNSKAEDYRKALREEYNIDFHNRTKGEK